MRKVLYWILPLLFSATASAEWEFSPPLTLSAQSGERFFHHLESAGRRNIAVSGETVAVAWEDDRDGTPRVYLARKGLDEAGFSSALQISGEGEAYEPSLAALGDGRFALAWEEAGQVRLRRVSADGVGPLLDIGEDESVQPSLHFDDGLLRLVVAEREGRFSRIYLHRFALVGEDRLKPLQRCAVDAAPPEDQQLYPTLTRRQGVTVVAWEDRRPGHTIIMAAESVAGESCAFDGPVRISLDPEDEEEAPYGRGHGVARVALAGYGDGGVYAAWADKRDFREGYDIYGADWRPEQGFGDNERVQDEFGGVARQWHATLAGDAQGRLVAAWTDEREGDSDIVFSWRQQGQWSEDLALAGAAGAGEQLHPTITLDERGQLHAAWVERDEVGGPTRLRYVVGRQAQSAAQR
ncbi:MAG: hypothetical protein ACQETD_12220 [Pseudomonadota bacterium]